MKVWLLIEEDIESSSVRMATLDEGIARSVAAKADLGLEDFELVTAEPVPVVIWYVWSTGTTTAKEFWPWDYELTYTIEPHVYPRERLVLCQDRDKAVAKWLELFG